MRGDHPVHLHPADGHRGDHVGPAAYAGADDDPTAHRVHPVTHVAEATAVRDGVRVQADAVVADHHGEHVARDAELHRDRRRRGMLAASCTASTQQKYNATSMSEVVVPIPWSVTVTGTLLATRLAHSRGDTLVGQRSRVDAPGEVDQQVARAESTASTCCSSTAPAARATAWPPSARGAG